MVAAGVISALPGTLLPSFDVRVRPGAAVDVVSIIVNIELRGARSAMAEGSSGHPKHDDCHQKLHLKF